MSDEAHLISTRRGVFRVAWVAADSVYRAMNVKNGQCFDFISEADAMAWIKGQPGARDPQPTAEPTAEELARWEAIEREIDAEHGPDGDPLSGQ